MIKSVVKCNGKADILVITPLYDGDRISSATKKSIKRNKTKFTWISYMGKNNPYKNMAIAYKTYKRKNDHVPDYILKLDGDITPSRGWLDRMYIALKNSDDNVAYAYTKFSFTGEINLSFDSIPFDPDKLRKNNYISSCSLMKRKCLDSIGGFVVDDRYFRLLDWALWLKFLNNGYIGTPVAGNGFEAYAGKNSVSCRSHEDYVEKYNRVIEDFVKNR